MNAARTLRRLAFGGALFAIGLNGHAAAQTAASAPPASLLDQIEEHFNDERFSNAFWGALIESHETGELWYERHADQGFIPASNQKALTTAAALNYLGPDWTFTTRFFADGEIEDGVLKGNLVVWSNGDPTHYGGSGSFRFHSDTRAPFREMAARIREAGITHIEGDVIGDDSAFDDQNINSTSVVSNLPNWPNAEFGPLQVNEGYIDVRVSAPETPEGNVTITPNIETSHITIRDEVRIVSEGRTSVSIARRDLDRNVITVSGTMKPGDSDATRSPSIIDPTMFFTTVLVETLNEEGVKVAGHPRDIDEFLGWTKTHDDLTELFTMDSPPLAEILKGLYKRSQNLYSETLVKTMGYEATGYGSFNSGRSVVREELDKIGVSSDMYVYSDGSGMSRYNFVSPRAMVQINRAMLDGEHGDLWWDIQPIAGVDGTLGGRMRGTPAADNVRAKTGTVANTRGLSGYVTTADGELLLFSFLVNAHTTSTGATNQVTDGVLELLASYSAE